MSLTAFVIILGYAEFRLACSKSSQHESEVTFDYEVCARLVQEGLTVTVAAGGLMLECIRYRPSRDRAVRTLIFYGFVAGQLVTFDRSWMFDG